MARVLVIGLATMDFVFQVETLPEEARKYRARAAEAVSGGCAANAAVAITRLGGEALLGTWLGFDHLGELIVSDLQREGVDTKHVQRTGGANSSFSSVYVDSAGERQIMNFREADPVVENAWIADVTGVDTVLCDTRWNQGAVAALKLARKTGVPGIVDAEAPVTAGTLEFASHVAFSRQGLLSLVHDADLPAALNKAAEKLGVWVCVTDGDKGVWYSGPNGIEHVAAYTVDAKDTLAAGDVWHGAFALALGEGRDESGAVRFANATAAIKCSRTGGRNGAPSRVEVEDFLKERTR
ncbi:MAG: PfkB family carbohydrate kinase [Paracoccaceae bacterium]|nr:PfkB family carbohydrate kinase [Paracoccaceae bacterium]